MTRPKIYDLFSEDGLFGQNATARDWLAMRDDSPHHLIGPLHDSNPLGSASKSDPATADQMRAAKGWGF